MLWLTHLSFKVLPNTLSGIFGSIFQFHAHFMALLTLVIMVGGMVTSLGQRQLPPTCRPALSTSGHIQLRSLSAEDQLG